MYKKSLADLHNSFLKGETRAAEIASYFLKRIEAFDPDLKAFLHPFSQRIVEKAEALDAKRRRGERVGRLAAIPIAIKDNMHVLGEITTCGSRFLANYRALFTATAVALLEEEDALLIGKTNLDEFSMGSSTEHSAFQITHNPWDFSKTPGGSSGGSAAAVAGRLCPAALGSDTGGSIRQPAAFTGTVGFKPTYGRVSRYGLVAFASSFDQIGPLTQDVESAALIMEVIGKHCPNDATSLNIPPESPLESLSSPIEGKKVGIPWKFLEGLPDASHRQFQNSLNLLREMGVTPVEIELPTLTYSIPIYYILTTAEASTNLARFDGIRYGKRSERARTLKEVYELSREEGFGPEVKQRILLGTFLLSSLYREAYYKKAQKIRTLLIREYKRAFETCDCIAMPVTPSAPFEISSLPNPLDMYLQDLYTTGVNLAGLPAISLPTGLDENALPRAIQFVGPQLGDSQLLHFGYQFQKGLPHAPLIPPLFDREVSA